MTAKCGSCGSDMQIIRKGKGMVIITCPKACYRLPAPSTVKGAKWYYESESEAVEAACKLHDLMQRDHPMREGDPRVHDRYRRAARN